MVEAIGDRGLRNDGADLAGYQLQCLGQGELQGEGGYTYGLPSYEGSQLHVNA